MKNDNSKCFDCIENLRWQSRRDKNNQKSGNFKFYAARLAEADFDF